MICLDLKCKSESWKQTVMADRMMALLVITREFTFVNRRKNRKNVANEENNEKLMALINGDDNNISLLTVIGRSG